MDEIIVLDSLWARIFRKWKLGLVILHIAVMLFAAGIAYLEKLPPSLSWELAALVMVALFTYLMNKDLHKWGKRPGNLLASSVVSSQTNLNWAMIFFLAASIYCACAPAWNWHYYEPLWPHIHVIAVVMAASLGAIINYRYWKSKVNERVPLTDDDIESLKSIRTRARHSFVWIELPIAAALVLVGISIMSDIFGSNPNNAMPLKYYQSFIGGAVGASASVGNVAYVYHWLGIK